MQDKNLLYFPRTCIYAIYANAPAATKCALTGIACPVCYTKECNMARQQTVKTTQYSTQYAAHSQDTNRRQRQREDGRVRGREKASPSFVFFLSNPCNTIGH